MSERAAADLIADLLLRHYREPMRYRGQAPRDAHVLGHLNVVLRLALGRPVALADPALQGPAVTAELERAAAFYIQQNFFREGASHYEIIGLPPDASTDSVRENFRLLMQLIHPDRHGVDTEWPEGYAARANRAYSVLKGTQTRADYDRQQAAARAQEAAARAQQPGRGAPSSGTQTSAAASRTHVPVRSSTYRQPMAPPMLPEWLTAGAGGFVLRHPGITAFAGLIALSALFIGAAIWPEHENALSAESAYAVPEPVKRPPVDPPRTTELPAMERASGVEASLSVRPIDTLVQGPEQTVSSAPAITATAGVPPRAPAPTAFVRSEPPPATRMAAVPAVVPLRVAESPPSARPGTLPAASAVSPPALLPAVAPPVPPPAIAATPAPAPSAVQSVAAYPPASPTVDPVSVPPGAVVSIVAVPVASERSVVATLPPPASAEVESLIAAFVSSYESGRLSVIGGLFHDDAQVNQQRGRAAIVSEYDQLFRSTTSRRMTISQMRWQAVGDRTEAKGELTVRTSWRDGREAEQRVAVDMEFVRQGGRAVISRLGMQPR